MKRRMLVMLLLLTMAIGLSGTPGAGAETPPTEGQEARESMYPVVEDGSITLDYWLPIHVNATKFITSYADNEAYQELQKKTGININFIHPASGQEAEQFNLLMASGDLPDMIQSTQRYNGGAAKAVQDGVFLDLTDYLEEFAPDYYGLITADADIRREFFDESGRVPAFYKVVSTPNKPWCRPILRQDWLEEFGMEPPVTLADYEAYFVAVLDNKPGVVPFYLPKHGTGADINKEEIFYGAFNILPEWLVTDGQIRYGNADPALLDYLTTMNDWYNKGYISKDFPSIDDKQVWAQFDTGKAGMYLDATNASLTRTAELPLEIDCCPYPRLEADSKLHCLIPTWKKDSGDSAAVSATSDNKEAAIMFLNYGYSPEGSMIYNYGVEGVTYNMVEGEPVYTDYVMKHPLYSPVNCNYILRIHFGPKLGMDDLVANPNIIKSPADVAFRIRWADDPNTDNAYRLPPFDLTAEENTRRAEIMANVRTYTDEMVLRFIIGSEPLENFDKYISRLNQYGMQEAIAITQAAYDRYMSKE